MQHPDLGRHDLLTAREAADLLRVKVSTIRSWTYRRRIPFVRLLNGRAVRYSERTIRKMIDRWTVRPLAGRRDSDDENA